MVSEMVLNPGQYPAMRPELTKCPEQSLGQDIPLCQARTDIQH